MLLKRELAQSKIGDCEICDSREVKVFLETGRIWMCESCQNKEEELTRRNEEARKVIEVSRHIDSLVELKQDVFNSPTVPFIELQAAVEHNTEIPADKKNDFLALEMKTRIETLTNAIFSEESALTTKKNERAMWQVNLQSVVSKLHIKEREKYKQFEINYKPQTPKSIKPHAVKGPVKFDKDAVFAAAKKYGVSAVDVQMRITGGSNKSPEKAAEFLVEQIALKHRIDAAMLKAMVVSPTRKEPAEDTAIQLKNLL